MIIRTQGTQKETQVIELKQKTSHMLHYTVEYDSKDPIGTIREFTGAVREMLSKYEFNKLRIFQIEAEMTDLEHYMEIASYKKVPEGYKLYRKYTELRRERRACKNENDLLQPIHEHFNATPVLNKLELVQGECAKAKGAIDARTYATRTDVLDEYLEPKKEKEVVVELKPVSDEDINDESMKEAL